MWELLDTVTTIETRNTPARLAGELTEAMWVGQKMLGSIQWGWIREALLQQNRRQEPPSPSQGTEWAARGTRSTAGLDSERDRLQRFMQHAGRLPSSMETASDILAMLNAMTGAVLVRTVELWMATYWPTSNRSGVAHHYHRWSRSHQQGGRPSAARKVLAWPEGSREAFESICRRALEQCPEGGALRNAFGARALELADGDELGLPNAWESWIDTVWSRPEYHPALQAGFARPRVKEWMQRLNIAETQGFHGALLRRPDWTVEALEYLHAKMGMEDWAHALVQLAEGPADTRPLVEAAMRDKDTGVALTALLASRWSGTDTQEGDERRIAVLVERMNQAGGARLLEEASSPFGGALREYLANPAVVEHRNRSVVRDLLVADPDGSVRIPLLGAIAARRAPRRSRPPPHRGPAFRVLAPMRET